MSLFAAVCLFVPGELSRDRHRSLRGDKTGELQVALLEPCDFLANFLW